MPASRPENTNPRTSRQDTQQNGESGIISRYGKPIAAEAPPEAHGDWQRQPEEFSDMARDLHLEADMAPEEADWTGPKEQHPWVLKPERRSWFPGWLEPSPGRT